MDWPPLSGEDWGNLVANSDARLLRYLGDWEEYEHRGVQCRFWRDTIVAQREAAVRRLQLMFRQFWFVKTPPPGAWRSVAYYFWPRGESLALHLAFKKTAHSSRSNAARIKSTRRSYRRERETGSAQVRVDHAAGGP